MLTMAIPFAADSKFWKNGLYFQHEDNSTLKVCYLLFVYVVNT